MPALRITKYDEGEHELLRVEVAGPCFGLSAVVDTRSHTDADADVEFVFEFSTDGLEWVRSGGMRGIGTGHDVHTYTSRNEHYVYGAKRADGHQYLESYAPQLPGIVYVRAVAIVHKGTLACDAFDLTVDVEQKDVPEGVRRSVGVVNKASVTGSAEAITTSPSFASTAGNCLVAGFGKGTSIVAVFTNAGGNTFTTRRENAAIGLADAVNITGHASETVTMTITGSFNTKDLGVLELVDVSATAFDAASTIASTFDSASPFLSTTNAIGASATSNRGLVCLWKDTGFGRSITGPAAPSTDEISLRSAQFIMSFEAVSGATSYTRSASATASLATDNVGATYVEEVSGGGSPQTVTASGIASEEAFGTGQLNFGLSGAGNIASAEAFGAARLDFTISGAGAIESAEAHGTPALGLVLAAEGIESLEAFGAGQLNFTISAAGAIATAEAFGTTALTGGVLIVLDAAANKTLIGPARVRELFETRVRTLTETRVRTLTDD